MAFPAYQALTPAPPPRLWFLMQEQQKVQVSDLVVDPDYIHE